MGFDQNETTPIIQPAKKETKINIGMVVAVILFFVLGAIAIAWMKSSHGF
jgi:preprotein translocase subunit SecE